MTRLIKLSKQTPISSSTNLPDDKLILTAATEELQEFVVEYGINVDDANSIFGEPAEFIWVAEDANDITTAEEE